MNKKMISDGVVHMTPEDLQKTILSDNKLLVIWEDITPLARNEWICWITSAKKQETRQRRIEVGCLKLISGMKRPCCWVGCIHR